jgi:hypothetical protein
MSNEGKLGNLSRAEKVISEKNSLDNKESTNTAGEKNSKEAKAEMRTKGKKQ